MFRTNTLPVSTRPSSKSLLHATRQFSASSAVKHQQLVVLGSGWGGYGFLRGIDKKRWNVTVISPSNYFNFTPLLASCAVGTLEFRTAVEPNTYQAWCDSIDFKRKTLECMPATPPIGFRDEHSAPTTASQTTVHYPGSGSTFPLRYDRLVIAVGCYSQTFGVPGVKEHAHFLKDVRDARAIRTKILECFEQANQPTITDEDRRKLLHFCIVGGGPTGVEFASELHDLLYSDIKRHYPTIAPLAKISCMIFDKGLQEWAAKKFNREGISVLTQHHVERVEAGRMFVKEQGEVPFGLLVWSTGLAPNPLVQSLDDVAKDTKTSSLFTDERLRVLMKDGSANPDVWAIGDAAMIKGQVLPATAQVASQKAKYLAKQLNAVVREKPSDAPFEFKNMGSLAYLGNWEAVYDRTHAASGPRGKETGRLAWLLWRSAYFTMTLSVRNKILVPTYWFLNWIFGRDLSRF
ncbi:FAD/NAD(P)-binding domain-containing protein [Amylocystis lapponica]|nr:FAD/NAD(P)-binding domain-containing protein [Amylocystis lapponica]